MQATVWSAGPYRWVWSAVVPGPGGLGRKRAEGEAATQHQAIRNARAAAGNPKLEVRRVRRP
jgi:hypothetical protein